MLLHRNGSWLKSAQEAKFLPCNQDLFQSCGGNSPHLSSCSTSKSILQPARLNFTDRGEPDVGLGPNSWVSMDRLERKPSLKKRSLPLDKSSRSLKSLQLPKTSIFENPFTSVDSVGAGGEANLISPRCYGSKHSRTVAVLLFLLFLSLFANIVFCYFLVT